MEKKATKNSPSGSTYVLGSLGLVALCLCAAMFFIFWQAILLGILLALIMWPLYWRLYRITKRRRLTSLSLCMLLLFIVLGPLLSLVGILVQQATELLTAAPVFIPQLLETLNQWLGGFSFLQDFSLSEASIRSYLSGKADTIVQNLSSFTLLQAGAWSDFLVELAVTFLVTYFCLADGGRLKKFFIQKFKMSESGINEFIVSMRHSGKAILLGTVAAALVQGLLLGLAFIISGLPGGALAAFLTFGFAFIPLLGSWPVTAVGVIMGLAMDNTLAVFIVGGFGLLAGIADNFVRVWFGGDDERIHPLLLFLAILGGLSLFGPLGVIFGPLILTLFFQVSDRTGILLKALAGRFQK